MNTVISQALATGLPVITTKHSGLPDQVIDGHNGYLVNEGDYEALADKILHFIDHPELWKDLSLNSRSHVQDNYDSGKLIDLQIQYYNDVINNNL